MQDNQTNSEEAAEAAWHGVFVVQIIQMAMIIGVVLFAVMVLFLTKFDAPADGPQEAVDVDSPLLTLSAIHLGVTALMYLLAYFLPRRLTDPTAAIARAQESGLDPMADVATVVAFLKAFHRRRVARMVCLEVPALVGLVICQIAGMSGLDAIDIHLYLLCLVPTVVFLVVGLFSLPTLNGVRLSYQDAADDNRREKETETGMTLENLDSRDYV